MIRGWKKIDKPKKPGWIVAERTYCNENFVVSLYREYTSKGEDSSGFFRLCITSLRDRRSKWLESRKDETWTMAYKIFMDIKYSDIG